MNNDLQQFSEVRLIDMQKHITAGMIVGHADALLIRQAIVALEAKQPKPVGVFVTVNEYTDTPYVSWLSSAYKLSAGDKLYTTPPANSPEIPDGWKLVPIQPTEEMINAWDSDMSQSYARVHAEQIGEDEVVFAYQAMLAAAPKPNGTLISEGTKNDSCQWNPDEDSVYSTGCGNEWQFTEGGIEDNKIKFCPYCSGKIAAPKPESE